jgi:hypothetical protein
MDSLIEKRSTTYYIANRAFGGLRKFGAIDRHRQIVGLAFKNEKIKTKHKALKPRLSELLQIWKQAKKIIERLEKNEKFSEENFSELLEQNINEINQRWK